MGERLPGARVVEVPGVDHLPWEGDQKAVLDQIELFLGSLDEAPAKPGLVLTTVLEADLPASESHLLDSVLSRFRGRELDPGGRGRVVRASFDGPARALRCALALADNVPALRAGIHTGECEVHDDTLSGPALAVAVLPGRHREARRGPGHLDGAGPRRGLRDRLRRARDARRPAPVQRAALTSARASSTSRGCALPRRGGARRLTEAWPDARAKSHCPARASPASSHGRPATIRGRRGGPGAEQDGVRTRISVRSPRGRRVARPRAP